MNVWTKAAHGLEPVQTVSLIDSSRGMGKDKGTSDVQPAMFQCNDDEPGLIISYPENLHADGKTYNVCYLL